MRIRKNTLKQIIAEAVNGSLLNEELDMEKIKAYYKKERMFHGSGMQPVMPGVPPMYDTQDQVNSAALGSTLRHFKIELDSDEAVKLAQELL